ncbi:uncharacterized protein N7477_010032 [Penicillium maclennaniae]|uniref:uncharacterized protein n=1 Tax=Penicillium maclennaniae TaxID=1343394 RepID=UPI00254034CF|nr:uncharacterized protein N7477_010032 [Penicillium maclennaniae]KAJ5662416.1 hypothetical protein N7477_010032 [Penicillium maclennaniae]
MPSPDHTEPASNWDFTAVLDLLRSPTYGDASTAARYPDPIDHPPSGGQSRENVSKVGDGDCRAATEVKPKRSHTQLGDFGSLWDLLISDRAPKNTPLGDPTPGPSLNTPSTILKRTSRGGTTTTESYHTTSKHAPSLTSSKPLVSSDTVLGCSSRSYNETHNQPPMTIFKRATDHVETPLPPRTPSKPIPGASNTKTPRAKVKAKAKSTGKDANFTSEWVSESSAEAESDSSTIIFDSPIIKKSGTLSFVPIQVGTTDARTGQDDTPPSSYDDPNLFSDADITRNIITTPLGIRVLPAVYKTATDRRAGLINKLIHRFPDYARHVSQAGSSSSSKKNLEERPVHVFVDMSNIMVGFHDSVKVSRNIPITTRIRRLHMSFANFSLIMERDRPATKRVLVGSDRLPSIDEAEKLGYEANILDRVHKNKHTTPRASKFRKGPQIASGPETVSNPGNRWVEQGVDEILHLKILESLLDTDEPATIVLATGDAAEAEYSGGFMRMVERALQRGWTVELVSFSQVTSYAYRRKEFREKWGDRFRWIELDDYVEELFD